MMGPGCGNRVDAQSRGGAHRRHDFTPTVFHRQFSAAIQPVLKVAPGDTIHTTTVDATGTDEKGVNRSMGGKSGNRTLQRRRRCSCQRVGQNDVPDRGLS
jgi:hypothetical protein